MFEGFLDLLDDLHYDDLLPQIISSLDNYLSQSVAREVLVRTPCHQTLLFRGPKDLPRPQPLFLDQIFEGIKFIEKTLFFLFEAISNCDEFIIMFLEQLPSSLR